MKRIKMAILYVFIALSGVCAAAESQTANESLNAPGVDITLISAVPLTKPSTRSTKVKVSYRAEGWANVWVKHLGLVPSTGTLEYITDDSSVTLQDPSSKKVIGTVAIVPTGQHASPSAVHYPNASDCLEGVKDAKGKLQKNMLILDWKDSVPLYPRLQDMAKKNLFELVLFGQELAQPIRYTNYKTFSVPSNPNAVALLALCITEPADGKFIVYKLFAEGRLRSLLTKPPSPVIKEFLEDQANKIVKEMVSYDK